MTRRDRRALRWGAALVLPLSFLMFVGRPGLAAWQAKAAELERELDLLERERLVITVGERFEQAVSVRGESITRVEQLGFGGAPALASSRMTEQLSRIAARAGLTGTRVETRGASDRSGGLQVLEMDLYAEGTWRSVRALFEAARGPTPLLTITSFDVSVRAAGGVHLSARVEGLMADGPMRKGWWGP